MHLGFLSSVGRFRSYRQRRPLSIGAFQLVCWFSASVLLLPAIHAAAGDQNDMPDTENITYDSGGAPIKAVLAKPQGSGTHPAVLVIHDDQGLTPEFKKITQQLAEAGFIAMAPDLLSRAGGAGSPTEAQSKLAALRPMVTVDDLRAALRYLEHDPEVDAEKISSIGFGWGGWRSFELATMEPNLHHAVIFYGATPVSGLENVHASVLANYAQYDFFDTGNSIWTEDTLKRSGTKFTSYIYPKTFRGFFDSANPHYDAEAARLAWSRMLPFLRS